MANREDFINQNMGLVHACAKRFRNKGIEYEDMIQAGCIGLIKAVDRFDVERGLKFSTYAVPAILGEIKRLFRDGGSVKVGRSLKELALKANKINSEHIVKTGKDLTINELAKVLETDPEQIALALSAGTVPVSLTACDDEGRTEIEIPVESHDEKLSEIIALKQIIKDLNSKDKAIIILRFFKNQTQVKTAKILGMSQVQVSRREKIILKNIKRKFIS